LTDDTLADLSAHLDPDAAQALGYAGQGFFPVAEPIPEPVRPRWIHKAILKQRIPAQKRIAVRVAAKTDPIIEDFLDLLNSADEVLLDNPETIAGMAYCVSLGLLSAQEAAEVLA
jgi:hypothetical protein